MRGLRRRLRLTPSSCPQRTPMPGRCGSCVPRDPGLPGSRSTVRGIGLPATVHRMPWPAANTGATSAPSSWWPRRRFRTNACPGIATPAVRLVFNPRIGQHRALIRPSPHPHRLLLSWPVLGNTAGVHRRGGPRSRLDHDDLDRSAVRAQANTNLPGPSGRGADEPHREVRRRRRPPRNGNRRPAASELARGYRHHGGTGDCVEVWTVLACAPPGLAEHVRTACD